MRKRSGTEYDTQSTMTSRSEMRRTRESFTRVLKRICERLDERNHFDVTHAALLDRKKLQSQAEITNLWVAGSYSRGAARCGDLDLVMQMRATKGSQPMARTVAAQAFGRLKDVSVYQGTPNENTSGIAFPEAVASHFARETDVLPLRPEQLGAVRETLEKLVAMRADRILDWTFTAYEATPERGNLSRQEEAVERLTQFWGKRSRELSPHILRYLRTRPFIWRRPISDRAELHCSGAHILVGRPAVPYDELDDLTCSRVVLAPHVSRRGPNGLLEIRRGERHPMEQAAAPLSFFVLKEKSGTLLHSVMGDRYEVALMIELFQTERAAREMAENLGDEEFVVDVIGGTALLDFVSCADVVEIYKRNGVTTTLAMTHYGAIALEEQERVSSTETSRPPVARTEEVVQHLKLAVRK